MTEGWEIRLSTSRGVPYFFNNDTKESTWDTPAGLTDEQIQNLPGAKKYLNNDAHAGQVRASHLLVKHRDSRRPASHRSPTITRTKEEAIEILRGYQSQINSSDSFASTFAELAHAHSDCSSFGKGGDLGWFGRGQMQKPFEDATFALEVNQISDIVSTDSGVHLIMRTG